VEVVECTSDPLVPVMEKVELLAALLAAVETVRVELPDPLIEDGEKEAAVPEGNPPAVRFTVPVNPFSAESVTV